jgi:hypothetical protein
VLEDVENDTKATLSARIRTVVGPGLHTLNKNCDNANIVL